MSRRGLNIFLYFVLWIQGFFIRVALGQEAGTVREYRQRSRSAVESGDLSSMYTPNFREYTNSFKGVSNINTYIEAVKRHRKWHTQKLYYQRKTARTTKEKNSINAKIMEINSYFNPYVPPSGPSEYEKLYYDPLTPELYTTQYLAREFTSQSGRKLKLKGTVILIDGNMVTIEGETEKETTSRIKINLLTLSKNDQTYIKGLWRVDNK